jgi:hypothetical protein
MDKIMNLLLFLIFSLINNTSFGQTYCKDYPNNCEKAIIFFQNNESVLNTIASKYGFDAKFIYSLVAPEVANFSEFEEDYQNASLLLLYINFCDSYIDFSVGHFQLKMSFLENLENEVKLNNSLSMFNFIIYFEATNKEGVRTERLKRMQDYKWQFEYLCLFYKYMEVKYKNTIFENIEDKLRFYSTAFNHSYTSDYSEILKWEKIAYFPQGFLNSKYIYCEICIELYNKL